MRRVKMKKILLIFLLCMVPAITFAASSATSAKGSNRHGVRVITVAWTADTDGSFTNYEIAIPPRGFIMQVITDPGSTAPTDNYDIALLDSDSVDVMGGELANRDTANTEQGSPLIGNAYGPRYISGKLTLTITNNSVNSAVGEVIIYVYDPVSDRN